MPAAVVGGNIRYPNLTSIASLFRAQINDSFAGATNTPGEGVVMPNLNPDLLVFMNSAIRDVYSDLRNVGDPALLLDNYCLIGLPALTQPDATVQVSLAFAGYFDGFQWHPEWTLPISCTKVERIWERWTGTNWNFSPMEPAPFGLPPCLQTQRMGSWELRQNAVWMPGCLVSVDLRLRCRITFPDFLNPTNIDFDTAYVPIEDSTNAIVAKMLLLYSKRYAPEQYQVCVAEDLRFMAKLRLEVVRNMQNTEYQRLEYGSEAQTGYGMLSQL